MPLVDEALVSYIQSVDALRCLLELGIKNCLLVMKVESLEDRHLLVLKQMSSSYDLNVLFYAQNISESSKVLIKEKDYQSIKVVLTKDELPSLTVLKRMAFGGTSMRREGREALKARVMVKPSSFSNNKHVDSKLKVLIEGVFEDFSKHGAKIRLEKIPFKVKDFLCVMYQDINGRWIEVESQVRWIADGGKNGKDKESVAMGLQFIAHSN